MNKKTANCEIVKSGGCNKHDASKLQDCPLYSVPSYWMSLLFVFVNVCLYEYIICKSYTLRYGAIQL